MGTSGPLDEGSNPRIAPIKVIVLSAPYQSAWVHDMFFLHMLVIHYDMIEYIKEVYTQLTHKRFKPG